MSEEEEDEEPQVADLTQLLERVSEAASGQERVSLDAIVKRLGQRSFGPLLLLTGVITLAPIIGDIPGVPTLLALLVLLVAAQLLIGRPCLWLPDWMLKRAVASDKVERSIGWLRRPARGIDRLLRPRLAVLTGWYGSRAIALCCIIIALAMPPMELVPFSANGAGLALTAFGLGLIARDGLLALLAFAVMVATMAAITIGLL